VSGDPGRRWRWATAAAVLVQVAVLYWPRPPAVGGGVPGLDLLVHVLVFGAVAYAGRRAGFAVVPLVTLLLAHAAASELAQAYLVPERTGDWRDVVADVTGTAAGALAAARGAPGRRGAAGRRGARSRART
jgi:hypothetical protein